MGLREIGKTGARYWSLLLIEAMLLPVAHAWGYRPFVSTDAAVADPQEMEIELGYFTLKRAAKENTFIVPQLRVNYGLTRNWEVVGEFEIEQSRDEKTQIVNAALSLKAVLKEGILQNQDSIGFAVEGGPLLPAPTPGERRFGFEGIGIVSGRLFPFTYHVNFGGGVERAKTHPFAIWGMIVEFPLLPHYRLVGEINGESVEGELADNSGLLGFIWQPSWSAVLIDVGVRKSISRGAPDWQLTTGLTWRFSVPSSSGAATVGGIP